MASRRATAEPEMGGWRGASTGFSAANPVGRSKDGGSQGCGEGERKGLGCSISRTWDGSEVLGTQEGREFK